MVGVTASYWTDILEALYTAFEALDVSAYRWGVSDGWNQSRGASEDFTRHLEVLIGLGGSVQMTKTAYLYAGRCVFAARHALDDDSVAQARLHAALRHACETLIGTVLPHSCRITNISSASIAGPTEGGYLVVSIAFELFSPR